MQSSIGQDEKDAVYSFLSFNEESAKLEEADSVQNHLESCHIPKRRSVDLRGFIFWCGVLILTVQQVTLTLDMDQFHKSKTNV